MHCRWYPSMPCNRSPGRGCYPSMHCRWYSSMPCSRSLGGGAAPGGVCSSGVCSWGRGVVWSSGLVTFSLKVAFWLKVVFCYGLQVWPSGKAFWYWGSLLTDPFNQKAIAEGHTRMAFCYPPQQTATVADGLYPTGMHSC